MQLSVRLDNNTFVKFRNDDFYFEIHRILPGVRQRVYGGHERVFREYASKSESK